MVSFCTLKQPYYVSNIIILILQMMRGSEGLSSLPKITVSGLTWYSEAGNLIPVLMKLNAPFPSTHSLELQVPLHNFILFPSPQPSFPLGVFLH